MEVQRSRGFPHVVFEFPSFLTLPCEALEGVVGDMESEKEAEPGEAPRPAWRPRASLASLLRPFPETPPPQAAVLRYPARPSLPKSAAVAVGTLVKGELNFIFYKMVLWIQNKI